MRQEQVFPIVTTLCLALLVGTAAEASQKRDRRGGILGQLGYIAHAPCACMFETRAASDGALSGLCAEVVIGHCPSGPVTVRIPSPIQTIDDPPPVCWPTVPERLLLGLEHTEGTWRFYGGKYRAYARLLPSDREAALFQVLKIASHRLHKKPRTPEQRAIDQEILRNVVLTSAGQSATWLALRMIRPEGADLVLAERFWALWEERDRPDAECAAVHGGELCCVVRFGHLWQQAFVQIEALAAHAVRGSGPPSEAARFAVVKLLTLLEDPDRSADEARQSAAWEAAWGIVLAANLRMDQEPPDANAKGGLEAKREWALAKAPGILKRVLARPAKSRGTGQ